MDPQVLQEMERLARAKAIIRKLESSDGQNMAHEMLTEGPNKGQTAGGAYGIVPNSLIDFVKQSRNRKMVVDPDLVNAMSRPADEVTKKLNEDRAFDEKAADMALKLLLSKTGGNEEQAAYGWRTGHNRTPEQFAKGAETHPYVQAYKKEAETYNAAKQPKRDVASEPPAEDVMSKIRNMLGF